MYTIPEISTIIKACKKPDEVIRVLEIIKNYWNLGFIFESLVGQIALDRIDEMGL